MRLVLFVVAGALALAAGLPKAALAQGVTLEQRVQRTEDLLSIQKLVVADYSTALDTRDWKAFGDLFTQDGELRLLSHAMPPMSFKGREAVRGALSGPPPANLPVPLPAERPVTMKHVITNPSVTLNGDTATATSYYSEVGKLANGKDILGASGYYADELKRVEGQWRFARRTIYDYDLPAKDQAGAAPQ